MYITKLRVNEARNSLHTFTSFLFFFFLGLVNPEQYLPQDGVIHVFFVHLELRLLPQVPSTDEGQRCADKYLYPHS